MKTHLLFALAAGCTPLSPVARDPWVEDRSLELSQERLILDVSADAVQVEAWFRFTPRGRAREHAMSFVIAEPRGAVASFSAELVHPGERRTVLRSTPGAAPPLSGAGETRDFSVPARSLGLRGTWMVVRYRQAAPRRFRYVLRSGAYWSGPIGRLEVTVHDPLRRVQRATVEGKGPDSSEGQQASWRFHDLEPRELVELELR